MGSWEAGQDGVVTLPDGRLIRGRALRAGALTPDLEPDFGLYLTSRPHAERGESRWIRWPDFRLPREQSEAITALRDAYERSLRMRVEIGCDGGKGRTGTAIAILARYAGVPAEDAVTWVRVNYRAGAIETPWQRRFAHRARLWI
ncbi:protein-tyrosine phosphatase family protein [Microbacterium lushaniae]|uniref:Protein phosphatase n=1 Tax=Microbacterium lushaniae TaxID=2614639 RepID=A0A5J6L089_9MICO|nr:protein-tyrosine phosphatase family protein [Microbacterium lushaniae]QEW01842.1 protein phosphatase [Microbacterium lushaniae]